MSDPVSNVQIEDVLASIRRLVSEEVRAQTRGEPAGNGAASGAPARSQGLFRSAPQASETDPAEPVAPKAEKLILAPHLRVATVDGAPEAEAPEAEEATPVRYSPEDFAPDAPAEGSAEDVADPDAYEDAPFAEVPESSAQEFAEEAEVFHAFPAERDQTAWTATPAQDEAEEDPRAEHDFDAVLRALDFGPAADLVEEDEEAAETFSPDEADFTDFGDGAAEALEAARHSSYAEAEEDARLDALEAVLSTLEFDPEPMTSAYGRGLRAEIEDAEILEDGEASAGFDRIFRDAEAEDDTSVVVDAEEASLPDPEPAPEPEIEPLEDLAPFADLQPETALPEDETVPEHEALAEDETLETGDPFAGGAVEEDDPFAPEAGESADPEGLALDEQVLRDMVAEIVRQELQGALGERITRNVRKLVRREIQRALQSQDYI